MMPETIKANVASPNTNGLCSLSQTICGNMDTTEDKAAPAPRATNKAGKAQQINVLELVSKDNTLLSRVCFMELFMIDLRFFS